MNILLLYYSGTFNTSFLVQKVKEEFCGEGHNVDAIDVSKNDGNIDIDKYDLVGLSYPIYGFNVPNKFLRFVRSINFKRQQKYFIFKNSGETLSLNNASSRKIIRYMKRKKTNFLGEYHFVFPYNIHFEFPKQFIKSIINEDKKLLKIMMHNLKNDVLHCYKSNIFITINAFFFSIQRWGGPINSFFYKVDKNKCVNCSKCIDECPNDNIYRKNGKIMFHHKCNMCMRCSFYCPVNAIDIGFLNGWKVHNYYNLDYYWNFPLDERDYVHNMSDKFYNNIITHFKNIDFDYKKIFKK